VRNWKLQDARAHFKDLFDEALARGPQRVTRHGKQAVVVVSEAEWERASRIGPAFGETLAGYPPSGGILPKRRSARIIRNRLFE
jgi:antitoxin Phd